jgi:hypothetical protein
MHAGALRAANDRTQSGLDARIDQRVARVADERINALVAQNAGDRIRCFDDSESL